MGALTVHDLSTEVRDKLHASLEPGENVVWVGRPVPIHAWGDEEPSTCESRFTRALSLTLKIVLGFFLTPFGLFAAAAVEEVFRGKTSIGGIIMTLLFVPILLVPVYFAYLIITTPLRAIRCARRRSYVATDRRTLILNEYADTVDLISFDLEKIESPRALRLLKSGLGDVVFGVKQEVIHSVDLGPSEVSWDRGFTAVPDARSVAEQLEGLRARRAEVMERERAANMQQTLADKLADLKSRATAD